MKSFEPFNTVDDIRTVERRGPWQSKSGGALDVLLALSQEEVETFLDYDNPEFASVDESGKNIRGLRAYTVSDIPRDSIGGLEWHRARTEYVNALGGRALWQCTDFNGNEREFLLDGSAAVITPPGILHTYKGLDENTQLQVICNTLYIPEDSSTHDTFTRDNFYETRATQHIQ